MYNIIRGRLVVTRGGDHETAGLDEKRALFGVRFLLGKGDGGVIVSTLENLKNDE